MSKLEPPKKYVQFVQRYPKLREAWDLMHEAEHEGPLDERTQRLIKLAIAIGAFREGATNAAVRKALAAGVSVEEMEQVVALSAATMGLPSAVAAHVWIQDVVKKETPV
jgi:4-carboxymuconolactone decarboxylase